MPHEFLGHKLKNHVRFGNDGTRFSVLFVPFLNHGSNGFLLGKYVWAAVFCANFLKNTINPYKYVFD